MNHTPLEESDQMALAELLDRLGLCWMHCANERKSKPQYIAKLKRLGMKTGYPDVTIFDPPPYNKNLKGAVIELKRKTGGRVSPNQAEWLRNLSERGWAAAICCGIDEAIGKLKEWGYIK